MKMVAIVLVVSFPSAAEDGLPFPLKSNTSLHIRGLDVGVFIPSGKVGFGAPAADIYIRLLLHDQSFALRNPYLVIILPMFGFFVRVVECRAFAIHGFITDKMAGNVMNSFLVLLIPLLHLLQRKSAGAPLAADHDIYGAADRYSLAAHGLSVRNAGTGLRRIHVVRRGEEFFAGVQDGLATRTL
jgi:hypothetical protein